LIYRWGCKSNIPLHKKQSRIIINTVALSFGLGTLINIILPVFHLQVLPAIAPSIGMAFYPKDGVTAEGLMKNADRAMYQAKEQGRNNYQGFDLNLNRSEAVL
jgi:GGDEF domain-containing protein